MQLKTKMNKDKNMTAAHKAEQRKIAKELGIDPKDLSLRPREKDMGQDPRSR